MMLGKLYSRISACLVMLFLLATAREASAQFQVRLEQSGFASKTVVDNGPGDTNAALGRITVTGAYGTFNINITTGLSKPAIGNGTSQATIDLNSTDFSTAAGGTLYLTLSDTDFNFPNNNAGNQMALKAQVSGTMAGSGISPIPAGSSIMFGSWVNVTNVSPLATDPTTIPAGSVATAPMGPFSSSTYADNTASVNFTKGAGPYSMFSQAVITMTGAGRTGFDLATIVTGQNCSGKLGNYVWNDLNQNGVQESGEPGIPGITVNLSKDGNPSATTTTDANGLYQFTGLCAATYSVSIPAQPGLAGFVASPTLQGGDFAFDSNPNPTTVLFATDNEDDQTIDFGYYIPAPHLTLVKTPKAGLFNQGDPISFNFVVGNDGGSAATNVMLTDQLPGNGGLMWMVAPGNPSQGSCTISGTNFLSCNLGTIQPSNFVTLTITSVGNTPAAACQAQPNPIALATGDGGLSAQDSGGWNCVPPQLSIVKTPKGGTFSQGAAIAFTIVVSNPAAAGASPATNVMLTDTLPDNGGLVWASATSSQGSCTLTSNNLSCALGTIAPGASVTVTVNSTATTPVDACQLQPNPSARATADGGLDVQDSGSLNCTKPASLGDFVWHDLNADGIQDSGEPGIPGVTVTLLKCDGTPTGMSTVTNGSGLYLFPNLTPDCYKVQFETPAGFTPTGADQGANDAADSDSVGGVTGNYTLNAGDNERTVDAGFYKLASLGDFVWKDLDRDGVQDAGEPGIPGVPVTLLKCDGTSTGMSATTDANGLYLFPNLTPGCYKVQFGTPAGYTPSPANQGSNDAADSDSVGGLTGNYTLNSGDNNLTVDAGFYQVPPLTAACVAAVTGQVGVAYSSAITATGGTAPYTFALNSGSLPPGLTLNTSTGAITGTPTTAGPFGFTVKVTDSTGNGALTAITSNCGITIAPPPMTAACVAATAGQVGVPYASSIGVIGGTAPYTFALASGALPNGLSLNVATGAITGTPTTAGPFAFTVMVTDSTLGVKAVATTSNCGITIAPPPPPPPCVPSVFAFSGNTAVSGAVGNLRSFTVNGVSVKASAFSRNDSTGAWATAYLGMYSSGLGVTDGSENGSNNTHKVDNIGGRDNYVLFEFDSPVTVDRVFLDAIANDSDVSVWIGTKTDPFNNHLTLSDALLSTLTYSEDQTSSTSTSRWADINSGAVSGNVIVIAALANDASPEDEFKISKLDISCPQPTPTCSGKIGDFVWKDVNNNGVQDSGEPGIAGVTLQLKNASGTVIATTTTDSTGKYQFTGLCAGTYTVVIPTPPSGYNASPSLAGTNRSIDSNGSPTTVTLAANDSSDQTLDFGFVPVTPPPPCVQRTFAFTGSTSTSGTAGNIRTFTVNGVSVKASAFSRSESSGTWATAYLGAYGQGLGVTDGSESGANNTHKVDNIGGRDNYILLEFSSPVILNRAFLDAISNDSDISVWMGNTPDPFNNHLTLSDSLLSGFAYEQNETSSTASSRWVDVNGGNVAGNVIVISALANDTTPEDEFKLSKLETQCPPTSACTGSIGDFVWKDTNGNGIQNTGELGISGVTVQLKKNGTVIATTTTNASGFYQFTGLCAGTYSVVIPNTPTGKVASPAAVGTNRAVDSNANPATVTLSTDTSSDMSIDFGYVPQTPTVCQDSRFTFTGNSASSGTAGNTRTFTINGISVKVTAFSRTSGGTWASAYLGLYGPGLGVTDGSEGNGSYGEHKVDNKGRTNYVLFEFSQPVVVNQAFLDAIGDDADLSIFIGTRTDPFNNHLTLSDSLLSSFNYEENPTSSTGTSRWANFNAAERTGNVLVLAAMVTDTTPEDEFKISKLDITCP